MDNGCTRVPVCSSSQVTDLLNIGDELGTWRHTESVIKCKRKNNKRGVDCWPA